MDKLRTENVAIVGFSETTRALAPFDDPDWEVWVCNRLPIVLAKDGNTGWDRHFDTHTLDESTRLQAGLCQEDWDELVAFLHADHGERFGRRRIVYVAEPTSGKMPSAKAMPYEEILAALPRRYIASGIAWEFAYAIALKPKRIALYGIDMRADEEWGFQRPNCEWLIGLAEGRGIEIVLPDTSALVNSDGGCTLYGSPDDPLGAYAEVEHYITDVVAAYDKEIEKLKKTNEGTFNLLNVYTGGKDALGQVVYRLRIKRRGGSLCDLKKEENGIQETKQIPKT